MTDHHAAAIEHLDRLPDDAGAWPHVAAAGIHAVLAIADAIRHGLRDIVYELRD